MYMCVFKEIHLSSLTSISKPLNASTKHETNPSMGLSLIHRLPSIVTQTGAGDPTAAVWDISSAKSGGRKRATVPAFSTHTETLPFSSVLHLLCLTVEQSLPAAAFQWRPWICQLPFPVVDESSTAHKLKWVLKTDIMTRTSIEEGRLASSQLPSPIAAKSKTRLAIDFEPGSLMTFISFCFSMFFGGSKSFWQHRELESLMAGETKRRISGIGTAGGAEQQKMKSTE